MRTLLGQIIVYRLGGNATIDIQNVFWGGVFGEHYGFVGKHTLVYISIHHLLKYSLPLQPITNWSLGHQYSLSTKILL